MSAAVRFVARYWLVLALAAVFAVAQAADFATYHPASEANPVIAGQPVSVALLLKMLLVVYVCAVSAVLVATGRFRRAAHAILILGAAVGVVGAATNLIR